MRNCNLKNLTDLISEQDVTNVSYDQENIVPS